MIYEFASIAKKLQADFERSANLPHQGVKGDAREDAVVVQFLKDYLPQRYSIGSGLISDVRGTFSRQQDIVLYDRLNMPLLQNFEQNKIFFAEQAHAVIEVKSTLTRTEVSDIIEKAKSIKALQRTQSARGSGTFVFGFAFKSKLSIEQVRDYVQGQIDQTGEDWGVAAIAILADKAGKTGLVSNVDRNDGRAVKVESAHADPIASIQTPNDGETLLTFYLLLMEALKLAQARAVSPNYLAYADAAGLGPVNVDIGRLGVQRMPHQEAIEVLRVTHMYSDEEVLRAWSHLMGFGLEHAYEAHNIDGACFTLGERRLMEGPTPQEVWRSFERYAGNQTIAADTPPLQYVVGWLRRAAAENSYLGIVDDLGVSHFRIGRLSPEQTS